MITAHSKWDGPLHILQCRVVKAPNGLVQRREPQRIVQCTYSNANRPAAAPEAYILWEERLYISLNLPTEH